MQLHELRTNEYLNAFIQDRKSQGLTAGTLYFYYTKLKVFSEYFDVPPNEITAPMLREYFIELTQTHTPGGVHCFYRATKSFFYWYENEFEPDWKINPMKLVKPPRLPDLPLDPVSIQDIEVLIRVSNVRDATIFKILFDCGLRASEMLALNREDCDLMNGVVFIRSGKGKRPRTVFIGRMTRQSLRKYLKTRTDNNQCLFATDEGTRLTYLGLRSIIYRRAQDAHITPPPPHAFRRAFCINMLRQNMDIVSLASLMGNSLAVIQRYLKQTNEDIRLAYSSPVDRGLYGGNR